MEVYPVKCYDTKLNTTFSLKLFLCDICNFSCNYCYNSKPRTLQQINYEKLINFYDQLKILTNNQIFRVELIGGEPTLYYKFIELINYIKQKYNNDIIFVYSNFSKPVEYYISLLKLGVQFDFSYHAIDNKINKVFINNAQILNKFIKFNTAPNLYVAYSIMIEPNFFEYTLQLYKIFKSFEFISENKTINVEFLKIDDPLTGKTVYTSEQLKRLELITSQSSYQAQVLYSDNSLKSHTFVELSENPIFCFKNWHCNAGLTRLYIHCNGDIYECQSAYENEKITHTHNSKGTLNNYEDIKLCKTICKYDFCACEWFIYKHKI